MRNRKIFNNIIFTRIVIFAIITIIMCTAAFPQEKPDSGQGEKDSGNTGAFIGALILLVLLVVYTLIVHAKGGEEGASCSFCACGRAGEQCEKKNTENKQKD